jgi:hypothetical protein
LKNKKLLELDYDDELVRKNYTKINDTKFNDTHIWQVKNKCNLNFTNKVLEQSEIMHYNPYYFHKTSKITNIIPNIINKYSFEKEKIPNEEDENIFIKMIEDFLYVIVPFMAIVFMIILVIQCKQVKIRRTRMAVNLSTLKQTTSLESSRLNDSTDSSSIIINSLV